MGEALFSDAALESVGTLAETIRVLTVTVRAREAELAIAAGRLAGLTHSHRELLLCTNRAIVCANRNMSRLETLQNAAFAVLSDADYRRVQLAWAEMIENRAAIEAEVSGRQSSGPSDAGGSG